LENSNIAPRKFVLFVYLWAHGAPHYMQLSLCDMSESIVVNWNNYLRDICSRWLLEHPIQLSGIGHVVAIGFLSFSLLC
jgi:hypothetical protein